VRGGVLAVCAGWILVAVQMAAVAIVLGPPRLHNAADFFTSGYATGVNTAAVITLLLWTASIAMLLVLAISDVRRLLRHTSSSSAALAMVLVAGTFCLGGGVARDEAGAFHPCCGSLTRAESDFGTAP
jgi:hypothetical protein